MSEWQPIETAPKDGTKIIVSDMRGTRISRWGVMYRCTVTAYPDYIPTVTNAPEGWVGAYPLGAPEVTHWMPLPEPPATLATEERERALKEGR